MAGRQLNKKLVVVLTLATFAGIALLSVLMLSQLQKRDPKYFVALAERSAEERQWQQAALFYNEAWERSGDAEYLVQVGEMLLREGEVGKATACWKQALVLQPQLLSAHERQLKLLQQLATLYGTSQRWEQVHEAAEAMLRVESGMTPVQKAFAHHANGLALLNLESRDANNTELGIRELEAAAATAPDVVEYPVALAAQFARQEKFDDAERHFRELMDHHASPGANAAKTRLAFAQYLAGRQRWDEAAPVFAESLKLAENAPAALREAQMGYAQFLAQRWARAMRDESTRPAGQGFFDEAEAILKRCMEADPEAFDAYLQMALLYKSSGRHQDVVDVCERRISRGLSRKGAEATQNKLGIFNLMIYASEACVALGLTVEDDASREKWLVRAEQYVADARGESPTHPRVLSQAGRVKLAKGQDRLALQDLRAADEAYGSFDIVNWENKIILAQVHLRLSEAGAAKAVLQGAIEQASRWRSNDPLFWNLYAQVLLQNNELDEALTITERILVANPTNADTKQIKAAILERQGRHADAGRLQQELAASPAMSALLAARAAILDGDVERALDVLRKALQTDPADIRLVSATVNEMVNRNRHVEAQAIVARARQIKPDDQRFAKLEALTRRNLADEQRDQAMLELYETTEDEFERALNLFVFYSRKNDYQKSLHWINEAERHLIARDTPLARNASATQHRALLKAKVRVGAQADDTAAMEAARDAALKYNVDGAGGKSILGWYHLQKREFDLALLALREAVAAQPTDAASFTHLGQCLELLGRSDEAGEAFEQAVRLNPNEALAHYGLAVAAHRRDDKETFERELAISERLLPDEPWVQEQLLVRMEENEPAKAVARREALLALKPKDDQNLRRLAALYEAVGDRSKADAAYSKLLELRPEDEKNIQAAASHYRRSGRPERAMQVVSNFATTRATPEQRASAQLLLANEQLQQGDAATAEKTLLDAEGVQQGVESARALARFYMQDARQPAKSAEWCAKAVERARRAKSPLLPTILEEEIACLLHRQVNDIDGARRDIAEFRADFPTYERAILWESELHARTGDLERAVSSLTEYLAKRPNDSFALYQRARHNAARGRLGPAIADLSVIKRTNPSALELQPRIFLARLQLRSGRKDLWLSELESLVTDAPNSATAVEELARAYFREREFDDTVRVVTTQINRAASSPEGRWLLLRGQVLLEQGEGNKALADLRRAAEISDFSPQSVVSVLTAYRRLGRFADGVEYFERYGGTAPTATLISHYAQLLAGAGKKDASIEQFRRAMSAALMESPAIARSVTEDVFAWFPAEEAIKAFSAPPSEVSLRRANEWILIRANTSAKRYDDATTLLRSLIQEATNPSERGELLHELGEVHRIAEQLDAAIGAYEEAGQYDKGNWINENNLAYLLSDKRGEHEKALPHAQRAAALNDNAFTRDTLGWIHVGLGQYASATAELSRAIALDPDYAVPYYHLGETYRRSAQFDEAAETLRNGRTVGENSNDASTVGLIAASIERTARRDATP